LNNYQNKTALIWDTGEGIEHARALAKVFKKVYYYKPWQENLPKFVNYAPGLGLEMEKTRHFFKHIDEADLIVFAATGQGDLADWLRKEGHRVFSAGRAEMIEESRSAFKKIAHGGGLNIPNWKEAIGISQARKLYKPGKWVKSNIYRGDKETFRADDQEEADLYFSQLEMQKWPFREDVPLVIEDHVHGVEPGFDTFFAGNSYTWPILIGYEGEYQGYLGKVVSEKSCPGPILSVLEAFLPPLSYLDCRSAISMEMKVTPYGKAYPLDITPRFPYVLSLTYPSVIENYPDVIWSVAEGEPITPKFRAPYVGCLALESTECQKEWVKLNFPASKEDHIKHVMFCKSGKNYYMVKGTDMPQCFVLVGWGNSYQNVIDQIIDLQKEVQCDGLVRHQEAELSVILKNIEKGRQYGIDF
jgi:hypothetical protein